MGKEKQREKEEALWHCLKKKLRYICRLSRLAGTDRMELLEGEAVLMAPPARVHQEISGELFRQLANFLEGKSAGSMRLLLRFVCLKEKRTGRKT